MRIGVFAGSFCPVTRGHVDVIRRSAKLVDKLYVVVGINVQKQYVMSDEDRLALLKKALVGIDNAEVVAYGGMMTDFCQSVSADVMIKAVRNAVDVQSVLDLTDINKRYWNGETVFIACDKQYQAVSSTLVRELLGLGKDISEYVPEGLKDDIVKAIKG